MSGDQRNLKLQGAWASVNRPTTLMSTPACAIQVGIAIQTSPSGRPEAKDCKATEARRQLRNMGGRLLQVGFVRDAPGRRAVQASASQCLMRSRRSLAT